MTKVFMETTNKVYSRKALLDIWAVMFAGIENGELCRVDRSRNVDLVASDWTPEKI